jgi:hypothetical protein
MNNKQFIIQKSSNLASSETRRVGIKERKLITSEDSLHQNVILIEVEQDAKVEFNTPRPFILGLRCNAF